MALSLSSCQLIAVMLHMFKGFMMRLDMAKVRLVMSMGELVVTSCMCVLIRGMRRLCGGVMLLVLGVCCHEAGVMSSALVCSHMIVHALDCLQSFGHDVLGRVHVREIRMVALYALVALMMRSGVVHVVSVMLSGLLVVILSMRLEEGGMRRLCGGVMLLVLGVCCHEAGVMWVSAEFQRMTSHLAVHCTDASHSRLQSRVNVFGDVRVREIGMCFMTRLVGRGILECSLVRLQRSLDVWRQSRMCQDFTVVILAAIMVV